MQVELSEQEIIQTLEFLNRAPLKGAESVAMAVLLQTYRDFLQPKDPSRDGAKESVSEEA